MRNPSLLEYSRESFGSRCAFHRRWFGEYFYIAEPCAAPSGLLQLILKITAGLTHVLYRCWISIRPEHFVCIAEQHCSNGREGPTPHRNQTVCQHETSTRWVLRKTWPGLCTCVWVRDHTTSCQNQRDGLSCCRAADTELRRTDGFEKCALLPGKDANVNWHLGWDWGACERPGNLKLSW